jgi:hypothetical protein
MVTMSTDHVDSIRSKISVLLNRNGNAQERVSVRTVAVFRVLPNPWTCFLCVSPSVLKVSPTLVLAIARCCVVRSLLSSSPPRTPSHAVRLPHLASHSIHVAPPPLPRRTPSLAVLGPACCSSRPRCCRRRYSPPEGRCRCDVRPQQGDVAMKAHVASVCFKCFKHFRGMLQLFHMDFAKVYRGCCTCCICCKCFRCLFKMFHLFETYVASDLIWMLYMFSHMLQQYVLNILVVSVLCCGKCFHVASCKCFI